MRVQNISVVSADTFDVNVTATGFASQTDALEFPADVIVVVDQEDTSTHTSGVKVPAAAAEGDIFHVVNAETSSLRVYPPSGSQFVGSGWGNGVDNPLIINARANVTIRCAGSGIFTASVAS